jgi:hypothetical protein
MNIDNYKEIANNDLKIDGTELGDESIRIPVLHGKWLNFFHDERLVQQKLEVDLVTLRKRKWEWYNGKLSQDELKELGWEPFSTRVLRQDMDIYMDADPDMLRIRSKIELQRGKVDYLDSILKGINNRNWVIRNAIEWRKFMSGVS